MFSNEYLLNLQIIQTFFVSAVSGSISSALTTILDHPEKIIDFLANSLPAQSSYFIQILLVFTFLFQGLDLIRAYPLGSALIRSFMGPRLTKKERSKPWNGIYPLEDPPEFSHAETFAQIVLFYVMIFVYSSISPITCVFLCFCFFFLESGYRYHFIHNHHNHPDSGGKIWKGFIHVLMASILIGQLTVMGALGLKKALYSIPTLSPLLAITILFMIFVTPRRMHASEFLPAVLCMEWDHQYEAQECDADFAKGQYLQPALQHPRLFPEEDGDEGSST